MHYIVQSKTPIGTAWVSICSYDNYHDAMKACTLARMGGHPGHIIRIIRQEIMQIFGPGENYSFTTFDMTGQPL